MDARHCRKNECRKPKCEKKECKKVEKCKSSSDSCEKTCVPKVVYQAQSKHGILSLGLTYAVVTPNVDGTYTCPEQIGQNIAITYNITNTGTADIRAPVMLYSSISGVNKVACKRLGVAETVTVTLNHKITQSDCESLNGITGVANAYVNLKNCLVLVSQPVAIQINNNETVITNTCCQAISTALGTFELQLADISANGSAALAAAFPAPLGVTRTTLATLALNGVSLEFRAAITDLIAKNCSGPCCESAALALRDSALGIANLIATAAADANILYTGFGTYPLVAPIPANLALVLAGLVGNDAFVLPAGSGLPVPAVDGSLAAQLALILSTVVC